MPGSDTALKFAPGAEDAFELDSLARAVRRADGFGIHFVTCFPPDSIPRLADALDSRLPVGASALRLALPEDRRADLLRHIQDSLPPGAPAPALIHLIGWEKFIDLNRANHSNLRALNLRREAWRTGLASTVVCWLHEAHLPLLAREAPDFFDWNASAYHFNFSSTAAITHNTIGDHNAIAIGRNINQNITINNAADNAIPRGLDLGRYRAALNRLCDSLRLADLSAHGSAYNELRLWQVFQPQLVRESRDYSPRIADLPREFLRELHRAGVAEERGEGFDASLREFYREQEPRPALDFAAVPGGEDCRRVVLLGDPGAGKTALLRHLAHGWAAGSGEAGATAEAPVPLLIELKTFLPFWLGDRARGFLDFFHDSPQAVASLDRLALHKLLSEGRAALLIDGLDEVFDAADRRAVAQAVAQVAHAYPKASIRLTSRPIGFDLASNVLLDAGFRIFYLQDFDDEQIKAFLAAWHGHTFSPGEERERDEKRERLSKAVVSSKAMRELAGNPLLLTLMAILNRHQELPRDRAQLYEEAAKLLLHQWDANKAFSEDHSPVRLDFQDKARLLRRLAWRLQASPGGLRANLVPGDDLKDELAAGIRAIGYGESEAARATRVLIQQLRERNYILCLAGGDAYQFVHRTFLEYFAATAIQWRYEKERKLDDHTLLSEVFLAHWEDETWREVILLLSGLLQPEAMAPFVQWLIAQPETWEEKKSHLLPRALKLALDILLEVRSRAKRALGEEWEGGYQRLVGRVRGVRDLLSWQSRETLDALVEHFGADSRVFPLLVGFVGDPSLSELMRREPVWSLGENFNKREETFGLLVGFVHDPGLPDEVREVAAGSLGGNFKEREETFGLLVGFVHDPGLPDGVREKAVERLGENFKEREETFGLLIGFVRDTGLPDEVRGTAVWSLGGNFDEREETFELLVGFVRDPGLPGEVRGAAVLSLGGNFNKREETFGLLVGFVRDPCLPDVVRGWAVRSLGRHLNEREETFRLLVGFVRDPGLPDEVRGEAVEWLGWSFDKREETLGLLAGFVRDPGLSDEVREAAVRSLVENFNEREETFGLLAGFVRDPGLPDAVRRESVEKLGANFHERKETFGLLAGFVGDPGLSVGVRGVAKMLLDTLPDR